MSHHVYMQAPEYFDLVPVEIPDWFEAWKEMVEGNPQGAFEVWWNQHFIPVHDPDGEWTFHDAIVIFYEHCVTESCGHITPEVAAERLAVYEASWRKDSQQNRRLREMLGI